MNAEIKKQNWVSFLESLSRRRFEWKTRIEVLSAELGDQIMCDRLPLNGITVEIRGDRMTIDISTGQNGNGHQTHRIVNPTRIAFLPADGGHRDMIDIEQKDGTKTLITFIEPMGVIAGFVEVDLAAAL